MRRGAGRARRIVALSIATAAAALALLVLRGPSSTSAAPAEHCPPPTSSLCTPETTVPTTTDTTEEDTTTSTTFETTTTQGETTTTRPTTSTTRSQATTTALDTIASADVLVPGDGTEGAELTTTTEVTATRISSGGPSDGTLIALVILGLVLIAFVVGVLTWRYWAATRPPVVDDDTHASDPH